MASIVMVYIVMAYAIMADVVMALANPVMNTHDLRDKKKYIGHRAMLHISYHNTLVIAA